MSKINLSGIWDLSCGKPGFKSVPAQIPGENCTALIDAGILPDPNIGFNEREFQWIRKYDWTWSRRFEVTADFLKQKRIWLNIDSLDTIGEIRINGKTVLHSRNMFCRIRQDVKNFLHEGENTIETIITAVEKYTTAEEEKSTLKIGAKSYYRSMPNLNLARKIQCQGSWDWGICMPVSGMYGDVSLDGSNGVRIEHVYTEQIHSSGECLLKVTAEIDSIFDEIQEVKFIFDGNEKSVSAELHKGMNKIETSFSVKNPKLWYPVGYGEHPLYDLAVEAASCSVKKRIGLRDLKTVSHPDEHGICLYFEVNGIPVFAKGADWIPLDSRPQTYTRERYDELLSDAVEANMNSLRVWGGGLYENEAFYELCDELGILVWQDCMFACSQYPSQPEFLKLVKQELSYQVKRLRDHACIAFWCGDNEIALGLSWGAPENRMRDTGNYARLNLAIETAVRENDPTRAYWMSSPCGGPLDYDYSLYHGDTHTWDIWSDCKPFSAYYDTVPRFCSEFGLQSLASMDAILRFTGGEDLNMTSPVMEYHQRRPGADAKILTMSRTTSDCPLILKIPYI